MPAAIAVIINACAGAGYTQEWVDNLTQIFRAGGLDVQVTLARDGAEIIDSANRAIAEKPPTIVVGGGDGTIDAVASALVGTEIALGVLPLGTLNHFAKDLRIPLDLDEAVRTIIAGHTIKVDVGEVNERFFLNNSSLGIYPSIVRDRENQQKRLGRSKWIAFGWATLTILRRYPFLHVRVIANGKEHTRLTPFVFIGNNEYVMEGFNIGERRCLDAGLLCLYVTQRTGRLGLLRLALRALFGRLHQAKDFDALTAQEILIEVRHAHMRIATDGEVNVMDTPLRYRVRSRALRVITPPIHAPDGEEK
ncbi:MAG: diacylglycerol/lipid kinase family protein [Burkholderiales bacterium]